LLDLALIHYLLQQQRTGPGRQRTAGRGSRSGKPKTLKLSAIELMFAVVPTILMTVAESVDGDTRAP
jgi:hypothetical protein